MTTSSNDPPARRGKKSDQSEVESNAQHEARRRALLSRPLPFSEFRPLSAIVQVTIAAFTRRGPAQTSNDDHYLVLRAGRSQETLATSLSTGELPAAFEEHGYAMLVADGLGRSGAGSVASRVALSAIAHMILDQGRWNLRVDPETADEIMDRAQQLYGRADLEVFARSMTTPLLSGIATSLTTAFSAGDSLFVAHVGHSRAYLFRHGILTRLTRDHTMESHLANSKGPVPVARRAQDARHMLTDAVGAGGGTPPVDVEQFRLTTGDVVMLCTNGLTDVVDEDQIADILAVPRQPSEVCQTLVDLAAQRNTQDNTTVVVAQYLIPRS